MQKMILAALALGLAATLSACGPLLLGGAGAVIADEVIEQDTGGDGLF